MVGVLSALLAVEPARSSHFGGTWTARASQRGGERNDRWSSRLEIHWQGGSWSGGLEVQLESSRLPDGVHHERGLGSVDLPSRWLAWSGRHRGRPLGIRLGTDSVQGASSSLVLGPTRVDGVTVRWSPDERTDLLFVAGHSEQVDPRELFDEPLTLFTEEQRTLGDDGQLVAVRGRRGLGRSAVLGSTLLGVSADDAPTVVLGSVDVEMERGPWSLEGELALREEGGSAIFLRNGLSPGDRWAAWLELRRHRRFFSPLGRLPVHSGRFTGDETDEDGAQLRFDWSITDRIEISHVLEGHRNRRLQSDGDGGGGVRSAVLQRLELTASLGRATALAWGFSHEQAGPLEARLHSLLVTHAFERGSRLSGRLSLDELTGGSTFTARVAWRQPLLRRRITLLVDDTFQRSPDGKGHSLRVGGTLRLSRIGYLTIRSVIDENGPDGWDASWYRRF
ncbi:MAG: hypothetical protein AAF533_17245 [Acidobacteriota bacterium]